MQIPDDERIAAFDRRFVRAQATHVVDLPWGFALLQSDFPLSHYHNRVVVTAAASAAEIVAAADDVLGGAGLAHRYVSVEDDELGQALRADLVTAGYEHESTVAMKYSGSGIDSVAHEVCAVSLEALRPALIREWRIMLPDATAELLDQLADRTGLYSRGAEVTRLVVFDGDVIAAYADLYTDREAQIAQFENLVTNRNFRGRGYGGALIRDALRRGRQAGCELSFLTADVDDGPRDWYRRLGYLDTSRAHNFSSHGATGSI